MNKVFSIWEIWFYDLALGTWAYLYYKFYKHDDEIIKYTTKEGFAELIKGGFIKKNKE